jgi:type VI protein secretion system component VasK
MGNNSLTELKFSGDWSLFHLLRKARVSEHNNQYHLIWEMKTAQGPTTVQLKLRPDRHSNVFANGLFSQFRLPSTIF